MKAQTRQLTEGALFAGIMGFGEGFRQAGFSNLWAIEKEPFCRAVIRTRFPETELFEDVRDCGKHNLRPVDVLTAGFPCQDLSVAGKRAGLAGSRSGLFWEVVRILGELRPAWFVLENVPGLFSSNEGRDFAVVLNALDELRYGLAWRVLDSQFFGVAQRRRRVFIVGCFGKPCPKEVLFESESGCGDFATGREEGTDFAGTLAAGSHASSERKQSIVPVAAPLSHGSGVIGNKPGRRREDGINLAVAALGGSGRSGGFQPNAEQSAGGHLQIVQQAISSKWAKGSSGPAGDEHHNLIAIRRAQTSSNGWGISTDGITHTLDGTGADAVCSPIDSDRVRTFAGLPEGLDSDRYRALGNAVTVKVSKWIGGRIKAVIEST